MGFFKVYGGWIALLFVLMFCCFAMLGFWQVFHSDYEYDLTAIKTCNYANNLTDIINLQSEVLRLYTGTNYTKLDKLNCNLLMVVEA